MFEWFGICAGYAPTQKHRRICAHTINSSIHTLITYVSYKYTYIYIYTCTHTHTDPCTTRLISYGKLAHLWWYAPGMRRSKIHSHSKLSGSRGRNICSRILSRERKGKVINILAENEKGKYQTSVRNTLLHGLGYAPGMRRRKKIQPSAFRSKLPEKSWYTESKRRQRERERERESEREREREH
jgi:hypothetical protein